MSKKLLKGKDMKDMEISEAVKIIDKNMDDMNMEDNDDEFEDVDSNDGDQVIKDIDDDELGGNMPLFTAELGALKEKAMGIKKSKKG